LLKQSENLVFPLNVEALGVPFSSTTQKLLQAVFSDF
jgi:hypothetical protein